MDKVGGEDKKTQRGGKFNLSLLIRDNRLTAAFHDNGLNTKIASFHLYAVFYFTRFNQSLHDFFNLVDLRLILMPMRDRQTDRCADRQTALYSANSRQHRMLLIATRPIKTNTRIP